MTETYDLNIPFTLEAVDRADAIAKAKRIEVHLDGEVVLTMGEVVVLPDEDGNGQSEHHTGGDS